MSGEETGATAPEDGPGTAPPSPRSVALFGGSFDPPHLGHLFAALYVLETQDVDELWFLPTFHHPFEKPLQPFAHRFAMCQLVAAALGQRARVSDIEARLGGQSRTLRTVTRLRLDLPTTRFFLVIGADLLGEVDGWFGGIELRRSVDFIVVNRSGHPPAPPATLPGEGQTHTVLIPAVSSTQVRQALGRGEDVSGWLSRSVLDYIASRGLYDLPPANSH